MAKTTTKSAPKRKSKSKPAATKPKSPARAVVRRGASSSGTEKGAVDALLKLLESPLVADLLAVGATAAVAALTEHRSNRKGAGTSKTVLRAVATAAAAAIGRRLTSEFEEIRNAANAKRTKSGGAA